MRVEEAGKEQKQGQCSFFGVPPPAPPRPTIKSVTVSIVSPVYLP